MKAANETQVNTTIKTDKASILRPALLVVGFVGLISVAGMAHAGVFELPVAELGWMDWSQAFSDGASSGYDAAGASF